MKPNEIDDHFDCRPLQALPNGEITLDVPTLQMFQHCSQSLVIKLGKRVRSRLHTSSPLPFQFAGAPIFPLPLISIKCL